MKFYGEVGFVKTTVNEISVAEESVIRLPYYGEIIRDRRRINSSDKIVKDVSIQNEISIVADKFMTDNLAWIKFVNWHGIDWSVDTVEINYPRINLTLGGVYNA